VTTSLQARDLLRGELVRVGVVLEAAEGVGPRPVRHSQDDSSAFQRDRSGPVFVMARRPDDEARRTTCCDRTAGLRLGGKDSPGEMELNPMSRESVGIDQPLLRRSAYSDLISALSSLSATPGGVCD